MNILKQYYLELDKLEYSEENILELISIRNKIIAFLKSKKNNRIKNHALHFVLLTKESEFQNFKDKQCDDQENNFKEAKSSLMSDLTHSCNEYWDSIQDPWNK
jgi:hypothetical protein